MGKYSDLLAVAEPSPTPVAGKYSDLLEAAPIESAPSSTSETEKAVAETENISTSKRFETSLNPQEETAFQVWKSHFAPNDSGLDYDFRGAFKSGLVPNASDGHWPDTFKKPNHPTFSVESIYAKYSPDKAGRWINGQYVPANAASRKAVESFLPSSVQKPLNAVVDTAKGIVTGFPQMVADTAKFAQGTPTEQLGTLLKGGVATAQLMQQVKDSPPFSQPWWNAVVPLSAQAAGEFAGVRGSARMIEKPPIQEVTDASKIGSTTEMGVLNKGKEVGGETPFRQQGEVTQTEVPAQTEGILNQPKGGDIIETQNEKVQGQAPEEAQGVREQGRQAVGSQEPLLTETGEQSPPAPQPILTSIKNAQVDTERKVRGLPPAMEAAQRSFGDVWNQAMGDIETNPELPDKLISELSEKPRALSDKEDAILLHRQIDLQNQFEKTADDLMIANSKSDPAAIDELNLKSAQLSDRLLDLYNVGKTAGTETGRGLAARKMLADEDFSLASMIRQKRSAVKGRGLTPEETEEVAQAHQKIKASQIAYDAYETSPQAEGYRKRLKTLAKTYQERTANKDFSPLKGKSITPDRDMLRLKAEVEGAKLEFRKGLAKDRLENRPTWEKALDGIAKWRRTFVLTWPTVLAKLTSASSELIGITPIEEAVRSGVTKVIPKIAAKSPRYGTGLSVDAEAKAIAGTWKSLFDSVPKKFKTGNSDIDLLYGKPDIMPHELKDYITNIHSALKEPARQNEFIRSQEKILRDYARKGVDISDPIIQTKAGFEAYKLANAQIFMENNVLANKMRQLMGAPEKVKSTGKPSVAGKVLQTGAKYEFPIVRIPLNIIKRTFEYSFGLPVGTARAVKAMVNGLDKLPTQEADAIIRNISRGSVGTAAVSYGYFNPQQFGGYYQRGEKRQAGDIKPGHVKLGKTDLPPYLVHNPLLAQFQIGSTIRRIVDSKLKKSDMTNQSYGAAIMGAYGGVIEEAPMAQQTERTLMALNPRERKQFVGELMRSGVPGAVEWAATKLDVDPNGTPIPRKPVEILDYPKAAIPGLRQEVPVKSNGTSRSMFPKPFSIRNSKPFSKPFGR